MQFECGKVPTFAPEPHNNTRFLPDNLRLMCAVNVFQGERRIKTGRQ